jgi:hypothetical protein
LGKIGCHEKIIQESEKICKCSRLKLGKQGNLRRYTARLSIPCRLKQASKNHGVLLSLRDSLELHGEKEDFRTKTPWNANHRTKGPRFDVTSVVKFFFYFQTENY